MSEGTPTTAPRGPRGPRAGFGAGLGLSLLLHAAAAAALLALGAAAAVPEPRPTIRASFEATVALEPDLGPLPRALPEPAARLRPETLLEPLEVADGPAPFADAAPEPARGASTASEAPFAGGPRRLPSRAGAGDGAGPAAGASAPAAGGRQGPRDPVFVPARPRRSDCAAPEYPRRARERGVEGAVRLRILVSEAGEVVSVAVEVPSGSESLDAAAREAARDWRFDPATEDGVPVPSTVLVPVSFHLKRDDGR